VTMLERLKGRLSARQKHVLKKSLQRGLTVGSRLLTPLRLIENRGRAHRRLEIGPGLHRLEGFETLSVNGGRHVDYVADASRRLPFADNTFEVIYASHVLEHIPWYSSAQTLREWVRIISPGGRLEVWVPNGALIVRTWIDAEAGQPELIAKDGWYKFYDDKDPCMWAAGRIFSYGDGAGSRGDPNWHLAIFSPRHLAGLMAGAGLVDIVELDRSQVRGHDHGWINLGMAGTKP
jgi:SAM-dependent methyltransferase